VSQAAVSLPVADYGPVKTTSARELAHLPGDMGLPFLGITLRAARDFEGTMRGMYLTHGPIAKTSLFFQDGVLVNGPENVRKIQLNVESDFSSWVGYANTVSEWFGKAILFRDYEDHRLQRRIVLSAFTIDAMKSYAEKSNVIAARTIENWHNLPNFIALPHLRQMLVHIAAKIFYGLDDISVGAAELSSAFTAMLNGMETVVKLDIWPFKYSRGVRGKKLVRNYLRALIPERSSGNGTDLMSRMVRASMDDQPPHLTEDELLDHLSLLFFAGYDTTTTTLLHMLLHLGQERDLQESMRAESIALGTSELDIADLEKLEGIDNAFQEVLRLYPATPFTLRGTAKDVELNGLRIPAKTLLFIPSIVNHTLPEYWKDPLKFDPSRFGKGREEHKAKNGAHYHPFGGGAHKCVGARFAAMNAKIFMHKLLLRYRFRTPTGYAPKMIKVPMPRPADGLPLTFERL